MKSMSLQGKTFAITGTLNHSRKCYIEFIEALGGEVKRNVSKQVNYVIEGEDARLNYTSKHFDAVINGVPRISEQELFTMAGLTLDNFRRVLNAERQEQRREYENSYAGKWERLKAQAIASIGKMGNAMVIPSECTRIYVHYRLGSRQHAALVKCISAHGVAFNDRNGKSCFYGWEQLEALRLMEVADYLAKLKSSEEKSFCRRLILLNREHGQSVKLSA